MPALARDTRRLGDKSLADSIATDYLHNYLYTLIDGQLYTREHIESMASAVKHSHEKAFDIFYYNAGRVDSIMGKGYARRIVDYVIAKEEIDPHFTRNGKEVKDPVWNGI